MKKSTIIPKRYSFSEIRDMAEIFRNNQSLSKNQIPVPIEEIVEYGLNLEIIPIHDMKSKSDIDGFLSNDLKSIYIDYRMYMEERYRLRLHFTLAHEVGHLILHSDEINKINFQNPDEWVNFRNEMDETDLNWFEQQAHEFAGRLLVPVDPLKKILENQRDNVEKYREISQNNDNDKLIEAIARTINHEFEVSPEVILRRIRAEKIWYELFPE